MGIKVVHHLDFGPYHFFWFVGILLAAAIASDGYLFREHRWGRVRVSFPEADVVLVGRVAFVMEAMILADHNPIVVSRVFHRGPTTRRKIFVQYVLRVPVDL